MTHGHHPFQGPNSKEKLNLNDCHYYIQNYGRREGTYDLSSVSFDLKDLIERMIEKDPQNRITANEVLLHPYFWDAEKALNYIRTVVDGKLKTEKLKDKRAKGSSELINLLERNRQSVTGGNWRARLCPLIQNTVDTGQGGRRKRTAYDSSSVYDLLLCIRDKVGS